MERPPLVEWLDFQNPTPKDIHFLKDRFHFHDVILKELEVPSVRAHLEIYDHYVFFVYNFPIYNETEETSRRAEIDFLITKHAVITIHYEPLLPLLGLKNVHAASAVNLLYTILGSFFQFEERQLRHINEKVESIASDLFKNKEREILKKISFLKRDISEYRIIVRSEESILNSLRERGPAVWGEASRVYLNDLAGDHFKIVNRVEDYREAVIDYEKTNSQILYSKTTEVMKTFTTLSFLTFPFMLFVAIFSMNVRGNPLLDLSEGFWVIFTVVIVSMITLGLYFQRKGWL